MPSTAPKVSVSTVAATATCTGHHLLKIEGFKRLRGMHRKHGSYFESCRFEAAGHTWTIRCYPNGYDKETAGYISFFLVHKEEEGGGRDGGGGGFHAESKLSLVYRRSRLLRWPTYGFKAVCTFDEGVNGWGVDFISVKEMKFWGFLKDDCLAVRCDIAVIEKSAVMDEVVKAADMERLGMLCKCTDDLCKRHHRRPSEAAGKKKLRKAFVRFFRSIGG